MIFQLAQVQNQLLENELRYQKQIKKFEIEIDELHGRLAKAQKPKNGNGKNGENNRISLVELYSAVLDELEKSREQLSYVNKPELPRIVVVGDQSSGKTSVLGKRY